MTAAYHWILLCVFPIGPNFEEAQKVLASEAQKSAAAGFRSAVCHGLHTGKANRSDILRRFGKPRWEGKGEDDRYWMAYRGIEGERGLTQFALDAKTKVLGLVTTSPDKLTLRQLQKRVGYGSVQIKMVSFGM